MGEALGQQPCVVQIAAGAQHTCLLSREGSVWCWGAGDRGQLGNLTMTASSNPSRVMEATPSDAMPLIGAVQIAAGVFRTCARKKNGTLWCWGEGTDGRARPTQVLAGASGPPFAAATWVAAGDRHNCAGKEDSSLWCWGSSASGGLGMGTVTTSPAPAPVLTAQGQPFASVVEVSSSIGFTCARKAEGSVWCWGENAFHQVGDVSGNQLHPVPTLPGSAVEIRAGGAHACARMSDGSVSCWGHPQLGQLGRPRLSGSGSGPVSVWAAPMSDLRGAVSIATGEAHTCAAMMDGRALCWGRAGSGQLGDGSTSPDSYEPRQVRTANGPLLAIVEVAAGPHYLNAGGGGDHSCARDAEGSVFCWGRGSAGQLGAGDMTSSAVAVKVDLSEVCR